MSDQVEDRGSQYLAADARSAVANESSAHNDQLDEVLYLQLAIAWAGEADTDPKRMGWWRTGMCDEYGGEDLLKRLTPKTWQWAALESVRAAAKKVDDRARNQAENPDNLITLYRLGFEIDEQLNERLLELKQSGVPLIEAFPDLEELIEDWSDRVKSTNSKDTSS